MLLKNLVRKTIVYVFYLEIFIQIIQFIEVIMSLADDHDDDDLCAPPGNGEDEEISLPRASINKIIKELVNLFL